MIAAYLKEISAEELKLFYNVIAR